MRFRGRLSPAQAEVHRELTLCGAAVTVARSLDEVIDLLTTLGVPISSRRPSGAARRIENDRS